MNRTAWVTLVAAVAVGFAAGYSMRKPGLDLFKSSSGTPVATWTGGRLTAEDLKKRLEEQTPFVRARYSTPERKKEFLDGLLRTELMAQEAMSRGMLSDPNVLDSTKKMMVQRLIQKEFDENEARKRFGDDELQKYYQDHLTDYEKPEMVRASHVFLAAPASDKALRGKKQSEAAQLLKELKARDATDYMAFAKAAREKSDDAQTKGIDGDLRYLSRPQMEEKLGKELAESVWKLDHIGALSEVIPTEQGFHIVKLQGRQAALDLGFDKVKEQIKSRMWYERRSKAFDDFLAELKKKSDLKIDEAALAKVEVDTGAPMNAPLPGQGLPIQVPPSMGQVLNQPPRASPAVANQAHPPAPVPAMAEKKNLPPPPPARN